MNNEVCPHCGAERTESESTALYPEYQCGSWWERISGEDVLHRYVMCADRVALKKEIEALKQANKDCMDWFEALRTDAGALWSALWGLSNDSQHIDHDCGDEIDCPVANARKVLEETKGIRGEVK